MEEQFRILQHDFKPTSSEFTLKNITWTVNPKWANHAMN